MNKPFTAAAALVFALAAGPAFSDHTHSPADDTSLEQVEHGNVNLGGSDAPATVKNPTGKAHVPGLKAFHKDSHDIYGGEGGGTEKSDENYTSSMEKAMSGHDMGYPVK